MSEDIEKTLNNIDIKSEPKISLSRYADKTNHLIYQNKVDYAIENYLTFEINDFKYWKLYDLGENLLAKKVDLNQYVKSCLFTEFLEYNGFNAPKIFDYIISKERSNGFMVMEKIDALDLINIEKHTNNEEFVKIISEYGSEIQKLVKLGIYPGDSIYFGNGLFNPNTNKFYFIDFDHWMFCNNEETFKRFQYEFNMTFKKYLD